MQSGIMVEPQVGGTYAEISDLAQWAEREGFDTFARSDHYLDMDRSAHATDALTTLAGLALETSSIKLTVLVTPLTFRHPGVIAKTAATIQEMSNGRFELGVGTGWMEGEHDTFGIELAPLGRRFDRFEESLGYLWAAFGRTSGGFAGEHFTLADVEIRPGAAGLPIVIGGSGMRRTPALAGRYADEYNMFITDPETLDRRLHVMRGAASDAGRDPDEILVSMVSSVVTAADRSGIEALIVEKAAARDMSVDEYRELLASRGLPHGTIDEVAQQFADVAKAGVGRFYIQIFDEVSAVDRDQVGLALSALRNV